MARYLFYTKRQIIFQSISKQITFLIQHLVVLPESCDKGVSRGILQRALLQKKTQSVVERLGLQVSGKPLGQYPSVPGLGGRGGTKKGGQTRSRALQPCSLALELWLRLKALTAKGALKTCQKATQ